MSIQTRLKSIFKRIIAEPEPHPKPEVIVEVKKQVETTISDSPKKANHHLVLYGRQSCPYCVRVYRAIDRLGISDLIEHRNTVYGGEWRAELRERTGRTQVPCMFIDGEEMFESLDIIDWLEANYS